jgi:capsular exopolysaccharide synthesis family protein
MNLLKALRNRWPLALGLGLVLMTAAGAVALYMAPERYTAFALLRVSSTEPELLPDSRFGGGPTPERYFENTQVALIKSRPIILAALRRPGIGELAMVRQQPDPVVWLEEVLKAFFLDKTDILRITLDGPNPAELAALVNAVKDAYMEEAVNAQRNQKLALLDDLEKVYLASEEKIRNQRVVLRQIAEAAKSGDPQTLTLKQNSLITELTAAKREVAVVRSEMRVAELTLQIQKKGAGGDPLVPDHLVDVILDADADVAKKKTQIAYYDTLRLELEKTVYPTDPALVKLANDRKTAEADLKRLREDRRAAAVKQITDRLKVERDVKGQDLGDKLDLLRRQEVLLLEDVNKLADEAKKVGLAAFELDLKRRELEDAEAVIKRLRQEKERLLVEVQSTKQRVTVLHPAEPPTSKNWMAQYRLVGLAGLGGLLAGLFVVAAWEARARRISSTDEVQDELGVRVVGEVPWVEPDGSPAEGADPQATPALLTESIDGIRAMLLYDAHERTSGQVLMVTSAVAQEGKTTLASHLALSVARAGLRTLVIDCDLRRPRIHDAFGLPPGPGLTEVLRAAVPPAEGIHPGPVEGLWAMPAGEGAHQLTPAQVTSGVRALLAELRGRYDLILVDCSPVLLVADALAVGRLVDGVLLSVRPRMSQLPLVSAACDRMASLRLPVLGVVMNGVRRSRAGYKYGAYAEVTS